MFHYGPNRSRFLQREVRGGGIHALEVLSRTHYIGNVEIEFTGTNLNQPRMRRDIGGVALELTEPNGHRNTRYQHKDHLGSIVALSTAEGVLHARMGFDPWGQRRDPEQVQVPWLQWVAPGASPFHVFAPPHWALAMLRETPRGYTGHEHLDAYGIIHMNGRIYDPHLARFLQADPFMEDTGTLNRYTYVFNNPMRYHDPSGYFTDDPLRFVVGVMAVAVTYGAAAPYFAGLAALSQTTATALTFATVGFVSGAVATGTLEGAFTGAIVGGLTGGMVGAGWDFGAQLLGRALIGGTVSHLQGGKFGHGFLAAGASFAASPAISKITTDEGAQMLGEMIVGGTISKATGGKFANGAISSAMSFAAGKITSNMGQEDAAGQSRNNSRTVPLLRSCDAGNFVACGYLRMINYYDLSLGLAYLQDQHPMILDRIGPDLPNIKFDYTLEYWEELSGHSEFWSGDITLSAGYNSQFDLVEILSHELLHSGDSAFVNMRSNFAENFKALSARHQEIYDLSYSVADGFEEWKESHR